MLSCSNMQSRSLLLFRGGQAAVIWITRAVTSPQQSDVIRGDQRWHADGRERHPWAANKAACHTPPYTSPSGMHSHFSISLSINSGETVHCFLYHTANANGSSMRIDAKCCFHWIYYQTWTLDSPFSAFTDNAILMEWIFNQLFERVI